MKTKLYFVLLGIAAAFSGTQAQVTPGTVLEEDIDPYLSAPAAHCAETIQVVIVRYLPTTDGIHIDTRQATDYWSLGEITLNDLKSKIDAYDLRVKFSLEEGSKFHGYKDPTAIPYLGYKVVKYLTVYRQIQHSAFLLGTEGGVRVYQPDYTKEFDDLDLTDYMKNNAVKEVWLWHGEPARPGWPSYDEAMHGDITACAGFVESNMSSPTTGDISNSYRYPGDLPVIGHTYVVYCQNFRRTQAEAVHNHGHQLESIYKYVSERQDGHYGLFVQDFCGWGNNNYTIPPLGRAGDTHHPPNTSQDYDYLNTTPAESDIENWQPGKGYAKQVNVDTWGNLAYNWPGEPEFQQKKESQWYLYWMQNMPGFNNNIPYGPHSMTNWWAFTAAWDESIGQNTGLYSLNDFVDTTPPAFDNMDDTDTLTGGVDCEAMLPDYVSQVQATDNADLDLEITQDPPAGTQVSGPAYTVKIIATDDSENTSEFSIHVVVRDMTKPVIECVGSQQFVADETHTYQVNGSELDPVYTHDNCGIARIENDFNGTATLENAAIPGGTTAITWTITDQSGNTDTCRCNVTVGEPVGMETLQQRGILMYPNPAAAAVHFDFKNNKIMRITLSDMSGKLLFSKKHPQQKETIDLSGFDRGAYLASIYTDKEIFRTKLVKR